MNMMKEAMLYTKQADNEVACQLCVHRCAIHEGKFGLCGVRENRKGTLYTHVYDKIIAAHIDPIEKKPFYHVLPGSTSFSIATVGCNFHCLHCQNADIAQFPREHPGSISGSPIIPDEIVENAVRRNCQSIAYTYTEPTIFFELAYDTAKLAHERGLKNLFVTNGYMTQEAVETISLYLDGANVDLKGFDDAKYRKVCGGKLEPVKESIRRMRELNIWVEVTTLIIPTHNDTETELRRIAKFLYEVDPGMPWHVSAFYPQYKMINLPPTSPSTIHKAVKIGKEEGLRYVYSGNIRSDDDADTWCYACGKKLIHRSGFSASENRISHGLCPACGASIDGIFE